MRHKLTLNKFFLKGLKVIGVFSISVAALFLLLLVAIQIPFVQQAIKDRVVVALEDKLGTTIGLDYIGLSLTSDVVLQGIYLEDQSGDTLFYAKELDIDVALTDLLHHQVNLESVQLLTSKACINRSANDSTFNFDYIQKAFYSPPGKSIDTTSSSWGFTLGRLEITDTKVGYLDSLTGNYIDLALGSLTVDVDTFDLEIPTISLKQMSLSSTKVNVLQTKLSTRVESSEPKVPFDFMLVELSLYDVHANYQHSKTGQMVRLDLGEFSMHLNHMNFAKREISLEDISILNTFIDYQKATPTISKNEERQDGDNKSDIQPGRDIQPAWHVVLNRLTLLNNSVQYYDFSIPPQEGFDVNHLWVTRLNGQAKNIALDGRNVTGNIGYLSLREKSGFELSSFQTMFALTDSTMFLRDFALLTPQSKISLQAHARYASLSTLSANYADAFVDINIDSSIVSVRDIRYFFPALIDSLPVSLPKEEKITLAADVSGQAANLSVNSLSLAGLTNSRLKASGHIAGLPRYDGTLSLSLEQFHTTKGDITTLLPEMFLKSPLNLPEWITLSGTAQGTMENPKVEALLESDVGTITMAATLNQLSDSVRANFKVELNINDLQLGKLSRQESTIGAISLTAHIDGSGLTMTQVNALVDLEVHSFSYHGYTYNDFKMKGHVDRYFFSGDASLDDKNLSFTFHGDLDYRNDIPEYTFVFRLEKADFQALNFTERPLKARGTVDVSLSTADFKVLNGTVNVRDVSVYNGDVMYRVDSLLFASIDQKGKTKITVRSDILSGDFNGTLNIFSVGTALQEHFNYYKRSPDLSYEPVTPPQNFSFNLQLKNTDLLTEVIVPKLEPFVPGEILGEFDSDDHRLDLQFNIANVHYGALGVDSILFDVASDKDSMNYSMKLRKINVDTLHMTSLEINGNLNPEGVEARLVILDSLRRIKYAIGGILNETDSITRFHLLPDALILNGNDWDTSPENLLTFSSKGMEAHNFYISRKMEKISVVSELPSHSSDVLFSNLNLRSITSLTEGTILVDGILNGKLQFAPDAISSSSKISNLEIAGVSWGNLSVELKQRSNGPYEADLQVEGQNANVIINAVYQQDSIAPTLDATAEIQNLNLEIIQPFARDQIKEIKGRLYGKLKISDRNNSTKVSGNLGFQNTTIIPTVTNSTFHLNDETILFDDQGIILRDFKIRDEKNNLATLKGSIQTDYNKAFDLNLALTAKNFQLLNTSEEDNDLYYGKVGISTTAQISGELSHPQIQMNVSLQDDSNLTYVIPQSEKGALEQRGIVVYVDKHANEDPFVSAFNPKDTINTMFRGIELTANIELDDKETFSIIIDPISGDKLTVKGNSTLTLDIDPSGNMSLSGRYEITEGTYDLTFYKLVKRKFSLVKGSSIIWTGQPLDAIMDISAIFEVEAAPLELLSNQISTSNSQELNTYRQRLPFLVYLIIKGNLSTPEISFQLDMPDDQRNAFGGAVYARIKDINTRESDLNKQVFALLILRRFISDNLFENQVGNDLSNSARRSVSRLLSEQLNRLTENIKGVELTFDVKSYEDYSSGQAQGQTKLQLGLSKQLLNDRLVVKVSGNVDIEGDRSNQNSLTQFIGDLALEYKLTPDGRLRITGFRNSNYDLIDGELIETGAGLIYIKDYDTLRELFNANAKDK